MQGFNVTRELASRLIGKSLRTVDRYLKSGKIRFIKVDGRTWLSREDVLNMAGKSNSKTDIYTDSPQSSYSDTENYSDFKASDYVENSSENSLMLNLENLQTENSKLTVQLEKNTNLLNLALKKIKVLKLELSNTIPLKDHNLKIQLHEDNQKKYQNYIKKMDFHYKTQQKKYQSKITNINDKLNSERMNKMIIAFILGLILILQPLIFIISK